MFMDSVQDSFAFVGLHCVHGYHAEGQLCLHRNALCLWVLCRRTALPLKNCICIVSMDSVQDSFAFVELHCVHGFCAGQLCCCRIALCPWILCRTALPL